MRVPMPWPHSPSNLSKNRDNEYRSQPSQPCPSHKVHCIAIVERRRTGSEYRGALMPLWDTKRAVDVLPFHRLNISNSSLSNHLKSLDSRSDAGDTIPHSWKRTSRHRRSVLRRTAYQIPHCRVEDHIIVPAVHRCCGQPYYTVKPFLKTPPQFEDGFSFRLLRNTSDQAENSTSSFGLRPAGSTSRTALR